MKTTFNDYIREYRIQQEKGILPEAYRELMRYLMKLRTHYSDKYSTQYAIGALHQGYMDISFFTFTPLVLKKQKLKIAIIFNHEKIQFEIWLAAQNKQIQKQYWEIFKGNDWDKYHIPSSTKDAFSIVETILVETPDFNDLENLTARIEENTMAFVKDMTEAIS